MKTFYKTLMLGVFMAVAAIVSPTFAQDVCAEIEPNQALYNKYLENYKGNLEQKKTAVKAGNEYIQKYGACKDYEQQVDYLKKAVPKKEAEIKAEEEAIAKQKIIDRFNAAVPKGDAAEIYASGEEFLAKVDPENLDVILVLGSVGLDEAAEKQNDTFNDKAIKYAKMAIQKIEAGKTSNNNYGAYKYTYGSKDNALGWMNYTLGYIDYFRKKQTETGLNTLYKATQFNSEVKDRDFIYALIGDKYVEKADALNKEIIEIIKTNNGETFESKSKLALSKGYADRAIEAYAKAHEVAKANAAKEKDAAAKAKKQEYVANLFNTLKGLYKFRYETVEKPIPDSELVQQLNTHIATVTSKPLTNPSSEVKPVDPPTEEEKTTETTTTSTTSTTEKPAATTKTATTTKPATPTTPAATKTATTNGATVKTDADKTANKPKKQ